MRKIYERDHFDRSCKLSYGNNYGFLWLRSGFRDGPHRRSAFVDRVPVCFTGRIQLLVANLLFLRNMGNVKMLTPWNAADALTSLTWWWSSLSLARWTCPTSPWSPGGRRRVAVPHSWSVPVAAGFWVVSAMTVATSCCRGPPSVPHCSLTSTTRSRGGSPDLRLPNRLLYLLVESSALVSYWPLRKRLLLSPRTFLKHNEQIDTILSILSLYSLPR
jgi:hypothetical protein